MEAAVRWAPNAGDQERFLIVDVSTQSLSLNRVTGRNQQSIEYENVARYERLSKFGAFDWSKRDESLVALGLVSGSACLVKLRSDGQESEVAVTFKLKQERKCNSIALNTENWLAAGLDKTRSDWCLNIFDINQVTHAEPVRRLCSAEVVSSVRFFPRHPHELIVAVQRSFIRLYDLRDGYIGGGTNGNTQIATRNVNNIAIDPLDENYFASAGSTDDPSVTVWDKRWIVQSSAGGSSSGAVFEFHPAVDSTSRASIWSLRYSGYQRGRLAICASSGELKVIDMMESQISKQQFSDYLPVNPFGGTPWSCNRYVTQTRCIEMPSRTDDAHRSSSGHHKLMAFDWTTGNSSVEQPIIALRRSRKIDLLNVPNVTPFAAVTPRQDFSIAFDDISIAETKIWPGSLGTNGAAEGLDSLDYGGEGLYSNTSADPLVLPCDSSQLSHLFMGSTLHQERCKQGYLFDCVRNRSIVSGDWQLERLWEIVERFRQQAAENVMVAESLDLSFLGVSGVWSELTGPSRYLIPSASLVQFTDAITALNTKLEIPAFEGERTDYPEHRQLCLALCGWKFTTDTLEEECQQLIDRGLYYQAIVQAVLHDYKHVALNLLRTLIRSKTVPNIGLGALLASDTLNDEQREMCQWMAADTTEPALKALLTYLTTGNWRDVMKTNYLHLGYRVALGLKYLNDTELNGFIQSETARAVKNGDLEGILLTGLSEQSMDLMQRYISRTNDLQTAVLATAFTNPLYVDDVRFEMWKETYFMQMQSWRTFSERSQFTVQHSRMAKTRDGKSLIDPPPNQVTLRCLHCHTSLAKPNGKTSKTSPGANISAGVVCPKCKKHMPRCGICKLWLGTPDPRKRAGAREVLKLEDAMAKFLTFCVRCEHGFHADHARSWFGKYEICPVPGCQCKCALK